MDFNYNEIFNWAEFRFANLFPNRSATQNFDKYIYRYYKESGIYLGINTETNEVVLLNENHPDLGIQVVGPLENYIPSIAADSNKAFGVNQAFDSLDRSYYPPENDIALYTAELVDLNKDGWKDFILHYGTGIINSPPNYFGPSPDRLHVWLSDGYGGWNLSNEKIFGQSAVSLGAASRKSVIYDFNADGYQDVAYAMNKEDGRSAETIENKFSNWEAQATVVMSKGDGTWSVDPLGPENYYHNVMVVDKPGGDFNLVFNSLNPGPMPQDLFPALAYGYDDGGWTSISGYPFISGATASAFNVSETSFYFSSVGLFDGSIALELYSLSGDRWSVLDSVIFSPTPEILNFEAWNGDASLSSVFNIGDEKLIGFHFWESIVIPATKDRGVILLAMASATKLPDEGLDSVIKQNELASYNKFFAYEFLDGKMIYLPDYLPDQNPDAQTYTYDSIDINGDGLLDFYISQTDKFINSEYTPSERLLAWVDDGFGNMIRILNMAIPQHTNANYGWARSALDDIDGDGIIDMFTWSTIMGLPNGELVDKNFSIDWGLFDASF